MPLSGPPVEGPQVALIADWIDRLPRKKPEEIVKERPGLISAAQKDIAAAKAEVVAIEARVRAEHAKYAKTPNPGLDKLIEAVKLKEREANLLRAEESFFRAQLKMSEAMAAPAQDDEQRKVRERSIAAAKKNLEAALAALNKPADAYTPLGKLSPKVSTGRRLALARWIASPGNPLTARVPSIISGLATSASHSCQA